MLGLAKADGPKFSKKAVLYLHVWLGKQSRGDNLERRKVLIIELVEN
jgi:hypothetical protein